MAKGTKIIIIIFVVIVIAGLMLRRTITGQRGASVTNNGPVDIKLIGIRPDFGDEVFDAQGKLVETSMAPATYSGGSMQNNLSRSLILQIPKTDESFQFAPWIRIYCNGKQLSSSGYSSEEISGEKERRIEQGLHIPRFWSSSFFGFFRRQRPVVTIDAAIRYYSGARQKAEITFSGPFEAGQIKTADGRTDCNLVVIKDNYTQQYEAGAQFRLEFPGRYDTYLPIAVYDNSGKRHFGISRSTSIDQRGSKIDFYTRGLFLEDISGIALEEPYEIRFNNILVKYPGRKDYQYPRYVYEMAKVLKLENQTLEEIERYQFSQKRQDAVKVMDVVRGYAIRRVADAIAYMEDFDKLDDESKANVRATVEKWMKTDDPAIRSAALLVALKAGKWSEYIDPAIEYLGEGNKQGDSSVAYALISCAPKMTDEQIARIKELILAQDRPEIIRQVIDCLANNQTDAAADALKEIAKRDEPWLWWQALVNLMSRKNYGLESSEAFQNLSDKMKMRLVLTAWAANRWPPKFEVPDLNDIQAQAYELLPQIFTAKTAEMGTSTINDLYRTIASRLDKHKATELFINFLRDVNSPQVYKSWYRQNQIPYYQKDNICRIVRNLNLWYGVNLGKLGVDAESGSRRHEVEPQTIEDTRQLIADVVNWYDKNREELEPVKLTLTSKVADTSGNPIAGISIELKKGKVSLTSTTDANGIFVFEGPFAEQHYQLNISADGYIKRDISISRRENGQLYIADDFYRRTKTIELQRPGKITGRIIAPDGGPLKKARIGVLSFNYGYRRISADTNGLFEIPDVTRGQHLIYYSDSKQADFQIERGGQTGSESKSVYVGPCDAIVVKIIEGQTIENVILDTSKSTAALEIELADTDGKPVKQAEIRFQAKYINEENGRASYISIFNTTGEEPNGIYNLKQLPVGEWFVSIIGDNNTERRPAAVELEDKQIAKCKIIVGLSEEDARQAYQGPVDFNDIFELKFLSWGIPRTDEPEITKRTFWAPDGNVVDEANVPPLLKRNSGPDKRYYSSCLLFILSDKGSGDLGNLSERFLLIDKYGNTIAQSSGSSGLSGGDYERWRIPSFCSNSLQDNRWPAKGDLIINYFAREWKTIKEFDPKKESKVHIQDGLDWSVERRGGMINYILSLPDWDQQAGQPEYRQVLVDKNGILQETRGLNKPGRGPWQTNFELNEASAADVNVIRIQHRKKLTKVFSDVRLNPNEKKDK